MIPTVKVLVKPTPNIQPEMHSDNPYVFSGSAMSLVSSSMRQQMLDSLVSAPGTSDARAWMNFIPSIPSPTKALETAAQAIALVRLSISLDAPEIRQESMKQYTQSLYHLQRALSHSKCGDEILGACMLLAMYEVFECPSNSRVAYHSHFHGCAKLVQLRGPTAYMEGFGHALFQGFRLMGVSTVPDV
jgi:Fungal specific transcription factor domain